MNLFLRRSLVGCLCLLLLLMGKAAMAEALHERPVLRALYADSVPYSFTGVDGNAQGYNIDVIRQLAEVAGYRVHFIPAENPQQILDLLEQGRADLTPFLALTPEHRAAGLATSSLGEYALSVYVRRDRKFETIEALAGMQVGVVLGEVTQTIVDRFPFAHIVQYNSSDEVLLPLMAGEIDAVVSVAETFEARLRTNFIEDKVRRLSPALTTVPYGLIVRRDLPDLHAALEGAIQTSATPAALMPMRAHWFGSSRSITEHPWFSNVALIVGGIGTAMVALTIYAVRLRRRSVQLQVENRENQLLIDAFDKTRGAIIIFGSDMKGVHWNGGFEKRFPQIVPKLCEGADIETVVKYAYANGIFQSEMSDQEIGDFATQTVQRLRAGGTVQRIIETQSGNTFDLSMFRLGRRHFAAIWVDVSVLYQQQAQIARQSEELARKNQQLLAFSTMAAHDLKAPLMQQATLIGFILEDLSDAKINLPSAAQSNFDTLTEVSHRMNTLVSDLLNYARSDVDASKAESFVPNSRLDGIFALSGIDPRIELVIMPNMPEILVEPNSFDLVMRNLITNAAKHNDQLAGRITIRAFKRDQSVVIEIEDDGPGVPENHRTRIFEPFCRLTKVEGTGLGLAFVKKTVESWGGEINLNGAPVRGCVFEVSLPAGPDNIAFLTHPEAFTERCCTT
jgi:two-component system sensor histidine kinase EvgS